MRSRAAKPEAVVIMLIGNVILENTVSALRGGACDFIGKPVKLGELQVTTRNWIEAHQLRREVGEIRHERARSQRKAANAASLGVHSFLPKP